MKQFSRAIFVNLCAVLITIATANKVSFIPRIYWSLVGLAVAHANEAKNHLPKQDTLDHRFIKPEPNSQGRQFD